MIDFKENVGTWFWFGDNEDLGGLRVRLLDAKEVRAIEKSTTTVKHKFNKRSGAREKIETRDEDAYDWLVTKKSIVDWKGISLSGTPLDFNDNNLRKMIKIPDFLSFYAECLGVITTENATIEEAELKAKEARVKNLKKPSAGK